MKIYKIIFILIFFFILLIPICFMNLKTEQISEIDNSKLPEISSVKDAYTLQNYISKRLGFRTQMINTYTYANDKLFNKMVHPAYTYGTNDYVFFKTEIELHDDEYLDIFANLVKSMQDYVTKRGKYFLFVINPTKISVYRQYLPEGYNFTNYRVNYLKAKLDELGVNYLDNTECLTNESKNLQVFNVKYDAGHWNDTGAFYGINNMYKKMQSDGINISELDENDYTIKFKVEDSLPVSEFKIYEEVPIYTLKKQDYEIIKKYNNIEISKKYKTFIQTINANTKNDLLFFRGSYMEGKEKFVSNNFATSYYIHNYENSINFDYYCNIADPDIVLFETVEYAIEEGYYPSNLMKNKKYNEVYGKFDNLKQDNNLINIDKDDMMNAIEKNDKKGIPLTKLTINDDNFEFAYLKLDNKIYDFTYNNQDASITLDTQKLKKATNIEIILISKDLKSQQITKIK